MNIIVRKHLSRIHTVQYSQWMAWICTTGASCGYEFHSRIPMRLIVFTAVSQVSKLFQTMFEWILVFGFHSVGPSRSWCGIGQNRSHPCLLRKRFEN
jgi:hypothetical protein